MERPPSVPQLQGVRATVSDGDRDTATLCLSQDAAGQTVGTIRSRKRQNPGRARRGTESQPSHSSSQASKEMQPMGKTRHGHAGVRKTDKMIAMETCGMSHRKIGNTDLSS